jgi:hypothetical protein
VAATRAANRLSPVRSLAVSILVAACACGDGGALAPDAPAPGGPDGGGDGVVLAPYPGWPADVRVRRVGDAFHASATKLELDPQGRVWLLRSDRRDQTPGLGSPVLERYAGDGRLEKRVALAADALVPDFVVHPSGELSVLVLEPEGMPVRYRLEITRVSADGDILSRTELQDTAGPNENLYYDDSGPHVIPTDPPLRFGDRSHLVGLADGEGLYLLAWSYGVKLYRLRADYSEVWDAQVMPANLGMAFYFTHELLATDDTGRVYVAYQIFEDDVKIYNQHFGRAPLQAIGRYDVLVERFDPDGTFSGAQVLGGPGGDNPTGMTAHGGKVLLTGGTRVAKLDLPNRTLEWDLFVLRGDLDDAGAASYRTVDLARDDFGWAMVEGVDGTIYIAGRTDYVQVDTNSEVEDGKGLLLALAPDLSRRAAVSLVGPRDVQLQTLRLAPDGRLLFAGMRDGPLTHTDPAMTHNEGFLGATTLAPP